MRNTYLPLKEEFVILKVISAIYFQAMHFDKTASIRRVTLFFLAWLVYAMAAAPAKGQGKFSDDLHLMGNLHYGYALPHYSFMGSIIEEPVYSGEISLFKEMRGSSIYDQLYNYPEYGLSLFYSTLGNEEVFGREWALTYFFKVYFMSDKRFRLFTRTGIGVSYASRSFDINSNYLNVAIGSGFNIHFNMRFGGSYRLSDKLSLNTGLSFDHLSNGNTNEPNLGLNYLTFYGGVSHLIGNKTEKIRHEEKPLEEKNDIRLFANIGGKHPRALTSTYFITSSITFDYQRVVSRKFRLGVGVDFFYDSSIRSSMEKMIREYRRVYDYQSGIHISQAIVFNRFSLILQEGIYVGLPERVNGYTFYSRGTIQYDLTETFSARLSMKSHLHILDYPEFGIGYKF